MRVDFKKGFTLIEILIAVSILAIISVLVWQAVGSSTASKERFDKKEEVFRGASLALNLISRDLQVAVLYSSPDLLGVASNGEQAMKSVFIGTDNGDQDKLSFMTLSHVRYLKDSKESDTAEVTYSIGPSEREDEEEERSGLFALKKREASPPDPEPEEGGKEVVLLEGVKELNFRYYDTHKEDFVDAWDSTKSDYLNKLPRAVEIVLVAADPVDEDATLTFSTVVYLEMAPGPDNF